MRKGIKNFEMDEIDRKLLNLLQKNAKIPYAEIGKMIGVSSSGVHKRIMSLVNAGVIRKFVALINPEFAGKKLKAFIGISTSSGSCRGVISQLSIRPEVLEIHEIAGEHDLLVKLLSRDTDELNEILHEIDKIQGVSSTKTFVVLKTEKETHSIEL